MINISAAKQFMRERKRIPLPVKRKPVLPEKQAATKSAPRPGATVLERIQSYCRKNTAPPITLDIKMEIGNLVKDQFFNNPVKKNHGAFKKKVKEKEGEFNVMVYPSFFIPVIDGIIFSYFKKSSK